MRNVSNLFLLATALSLALNSCGSRPSPTVTALAPATELPTLTTIPPTPEPTPIPKRRTIIVTNAEDHGSGTLRQALEEAGPYEEIIFDADVFPPDAPVTIALNSGLPGLNQGYLTIDASNAGVILDGSQAGGDWTAGIEINSEENIIRGLQVVHFTGPGTLLNPPARFNTVGGDRNVGLGPMGQGNLFSDNSEGVAIRGSDNIITGNLIGTDITGSGSMGNRYPGLFLEENASRNVIGPNNIIAYNGIVGGGGIEIRSLNEQANIITANSIHSNSDKGIFYNNSESAQFVSPTIPFIFDFDLASGMVKRHSLPGLRRRNFQHKHKRWRVLRGDGHSEPIWQLFL